MLVQLSFVRVEFPIQLLIVSHLVGAYPVILLLLCFIYCAEICLIETWISFSKNECLYTLRFLDHQCFDKYNSNSKWNGDLSTAPFALSVFLPPLFVLLILAVEIKLLRARNCRLSFSTHKYFLSVTFSFITMWCQLWVPSQYLLSYFSGACWKQLCVQKWDTPFCCRTHTSIAGCSSRSNFASYQICSVFSMWSWRSSFLPGHFPLSSFLLYLSCKYLCISGFLIYK